jgi:hypothetical protein
MSRPTVGLITVTQPTRLACLQNRIREMRRSVVPYDQWVICAPITVLNSIYDGANSWDNRIQYLPSDITEIVPRRNLCVAKIETDIVLHVDDDDWQSPERIKVQVEALASCDVTGTNWVYAYWRDTQEIQRISYWGAECNVVGATLAYRRSAWVETPFQDGEEGPFTAHHHAKGRFLDTRHPSLILYSRGPKNFSDARMFRDPIKSGARLPPHEIVRQRQLNPSLPLRLNWDVTCEEAERKHFSMVNRSYWMDQMGERTFDYFEAETP